MSLVTVETLPVLRIVKVTAPNGFEREGDLMKLRRRHDSPEKEAPSIVEAGEVRISRLEQPPLVVWAKPGRPRKGDWTFRFLDMSPRVAGPRVLAPERDLQGYITLYTTSQQRFAEMEIVKEGDRLYAVLPAIDDLEEMSRFVTLQRLDQKPQRLEVDVAKMMVGEVYLRRRKQFLNIASPR